MQDACHFFDRSRQVLPKQGIPLIQVHSERSCGWNTIVATARRLLTLGSVESKNYRSTKKNFPNSVVDRDSGPPQNRVVAASTEVGNIDPGWQLTCIRY